MLTPGERKEFERCRKLLARGILTEAEVVRRLGAVVRPSNFESLLEELPQALHEPLRIQLASYRPVRAVGYWCQLGAATTDPGFRAPSTSVLPDPRRLVCPGPYPVSREAVVRYLRAGSVYVQWRGLSYCRFSCGVDFSLMGSRCLTDGAWVWPEGLPHYVEAHSVLLPEEFLRWVVEADNRVPCSDPMPSYDTQGEPDYEFWKAWGRSMGAIQVRH